MEIKDVAKCQEKLEQLTLACQKYDPDMAELALNELQNLLPKVKLLELRNAVENFDFSSAIHLSEKLKLNLVHEV